MSVTYGFYNSNKGDRKYDASHFSQIFNGIINDGVFMSVGDKLMVSKNSGMVLSVGSGRAWINGTWLYNDADLPIEVEMSELLTNRIDTVVMEFNNDFTVRANQIKIIKGAPAETPEKTALTNNDKIKQIPLAYISVKKAATEINQEDITNVIGTSECPFVTGILETMDIDALISKWGDQWDRWFTGANSDWDKWLNDTKVETDTFQEKEQQEFLEWFNELKNKLDSEAAGKLMNEINLIKERVLKLETQVNYQMINYTLEASKWSEKRYSFEEDYPFAEKDLEISLNSNCTEAQYGAYADAQIVGSLTDQTILCIGAAPGIDIPITLKVVNK